MPIYARNKGGNYVPAPEGLQRAVCCDVVDLGVVKTNFGNQEKVEIRWQSEEKMEDGKPYLIIKRYNPSLHPKANLRSDLESWRGKKFTDDEAFEFDLEKLLYQNCQINIVHNKTESGTYGNVKSVVPAAKGVKPLKIEDYVRMCERPDWKPPKRETVDRHEEVPGNDPREDDEGDIPF